MPSNPAKTHIDISFIGAPSADDMGNCRAIGSQNGADCGVLGYAAIDAQYADKVVVVTDTLVPFPQTFPCLHRYDQRGLMW